MIGRSLPLFVVAALRLVVPVLIACATLAGAALAKTGSLRTIPACFVSTGEKADRPPTGAARPPVVVQLEIADTADARATGLMHRQHLDADAGMLFVFSAQRPGNTGFWMYNTLIPLDIAFLDDDGHIGRILTMTPCPHQRATRCPSYRPGVPYRQAVEMNAGFFDRHSLSEGDRLLTGASCPAGDRP